MHSIIKLRLPIKPKAHQSVRSGGGMFYQKKSVKIFKQEVQMLSKPQLPEGFKPFHKDTPLVLTITHLFKHRKKTKKSDLNKIIPKTTKPDVTDNLQKAVVDALAGLIYEQDQQICGCIAFKYWATGDGIGIKIETYENYLASLR